MAKGVSGSAWRMTLLSAGVLAFAGMGDALLYVVLPLEGAAFGLSLTWVGILLSANRFARVLLYGEVARLARRIGPRNLSILAAVGAVASSFTYGLVESPWLQLAARVVWGLAFAALNLTTMAYAWGDGRDGRAGARMGASRGLRQTGLAAACAAGAWFAVVAGPREAMIATAIASLPAIALAFMLPAAEPGRRSEERVWTRPMPVDVYIFVFGVVVDGGFVLTMAAVLGEGTDAENALLAAGFSWALRYLVVVAVAPVGGILCDRWGATRLLIGSSAAVVAGLVVVALGWGPAGVIIVVLTRSVVDTTAPIVAAERSRGDVLIAVSRTATWRDMGAAVGPVAAGVSIGLMPLGPYYAMLAVILAAVTLWMARVERNGR
ncbi:MAG: MFS transporter [Alphaproteobacteria bacterium]